VKLLLDENLAPRLVAKLEGSFPGSRHVRDVGLREASDLAVWSLARTQGFAIVSKDWDFQQLSFVHGAPPKVVWIRRGNCSVREMERLLVSSRDVITRFGDDQEASLLILS
jgi:predicted nuclease of predicted toxin-antitoxin system